MTRNTLLLLFVVGVAAGEQILLQTARDQTEEALVASSEKLEESLADYATKSSKNLAGCSDVHDACDDPLGGLVDDPAFPIGERVSYDTIQSYNYDPTHESVLGCALNQLQPTLQDNYETTEPYGKWQYMGAQTTGSFHLFPAMENFEYCGTKYDPRGRWWYATLTPKDLAIVVPWFKGMNEVQSSLAYKLAFDIVDRTVSYLDTVTFVLYGDSENYVVSETQAVNFETREALKNFLDTTPRLETTSSDFVFGAQRAMQALRQANEAGKTTECKSAVILITAASVTTESVPPVSAEELVLENDAEYPVITFVVGNFEGETRAKKIACNNHGTVITVPSDTPLDSVINYAGHYIDYFASALDPETTQPRWSEPYLDGLGLGTVLSVCIPFFQLSKKSTEFTGMNCMDIVVDDFLNATDFNQTYYNDTNSMVANSRICPDATYNETSLQRARESLIAAGFIDNVCSFKSGGHNRLNGGERAGIFIAGLVVAVIILVLYTVLGYIRGGSAKCIILTGVLFYCIAASLFWWITYDTIVDRENFVATDCDLIAVDDSPYRCCEIGGCKCQNCGAGDPKCSERLADLTDGPCCKGYYCCETSCCRWCTRCSTSSNGHRSCSTYCCNRCCTQSVKHRLCESYCGTCHKMYATVDVTIEGAPRRYVHAGKCGLDKTDCVDNWYDKYTEDYVSKCYYDKTTTGAQDDLVVKFNQSSFNWAAIAFEIIFLVGFVVCAGVLLFGKTGDSDSSPSSKGVVPMSEMNRFG